MNQNQNKKTLRHFQCRDFLWEIFEQMSGELECSVDYLINEAMRQYARARNYSPQQGAGAPGGVAPQALPNRPMQGGGPMPPAPIQGGMPGRQPMPPRPGPPPPIPPGGRPQPPRPVPPGGRVTGGMQPHPGMPPGVQGGYQQPGGMQQPQPMGGMQPQPVGGMQPQPVGGMQPQPMGGPPRGGPAPVPVGGPAPGGGQGRLSLIFNGRKIPVTKEQFIIGRGTKSSDLAIKDGNISRKHAAVILHNNVYYIKDLGSTNGIEYNGMRIDNKRVEEGDVFHICDYELRFTYR